MFVRRIFISAVLFLLVASIFVPGCQRKSDEEIKIGCVMPLTGSGSLWGQNGRKGVELALAEINGAGGIGGKKVRVLFEDSQTEPRTAVSAFRKLVDIEGVKASIVDMISSNVLAIAPIANEKKVVIISPGASSPEITTAGDYVFRNWPSDALQGEEAASIAFKKLGWKRIGIFYINNEYGKGLRNVFGKTFTELGGQVIIEETFEQGASDFRTSISKLGRARLDGIYLIGYPKEVPIIIKQSRELRLPVNFLGTETFEDPGILQQAGQAAEGVLYLLPKSPDPQSGKAKHFREAFRTKFGEEPGVPADVAYDALFILKWAIERVGYDPDKIKDQLYLLKDWEGASGLTSFDSNGDAIKPFDLKTVKSGQFTFYP